ncbi:MAG: histidine kinase dimerization/phosphoacceptor domain -containing protein [Bacteroidota bacterium]
MKYLVIFLLILVGLGKGYAQEEKVTKKTFDKPPKLTEQDYHKALVLFDGNEALPPEKFSEAMNTAMTYLMMNQDRKGQIQFFEKAARFSKRVGNVDDYIDMKSNKAMILISNNQPLDAIATIDTLLITYEVSPNLKARFYKAIGDAYDDLENLEKAEENFLKGIEVAAENKDTFQMGINYISLANAHYHLGNIYDAIDYNIKGLNILENGDHAYIVSGACKVLCSIFQDLGNYEKAQEYAEKMDQLCQMNGYKQMGAVAHGTLGKLALRRGEYDKALNYFDLVLEESTRKKVRIHATYSERVAFNVKTDMIRTYMKIGDFAKANALLSKLSTEDMGALYDDSKLTFYELEIESAIHAKDNAKVRSTLSLVNKLIDEEASFKLKKRLAGINKKVAEYFGNYHEANKHLNTFFAYKDSIEHEQKAQLVLNLEAKYQKAEQEKAISQLSYENEKAEFQIKQKNIVLTLGAIGLTILSFLVFQFYKLYQTNKENKEQLASQNVIITKALDDKNTLLKEIHHRVKNNLQVISSLLSLQSRYIKDEDTLDAIKAGKSRVQSMSLLHQNLYRDDNLKGVDMKQYFQNLGQNLFDTYNIEENIKLTTDIDDITLDIDTVVPIGLITNELISNSLKHAFKGRDYGTIHLGLKETGKKLLLTVKDNGVGLPDGELPVSYKSLGATLIQSFAEKLEGEIKIDTAEGSEVTVEINDYTLV